MSWGISAMWARRKGADLESEHRKQLEEKNARIGALVQEVIDRGNVINQLRSEAAVLTQQRDRLRRRLRRVQRQLEAAGR